MGVLGFGFGLVWLGLGWVALLCVWLGLDVMVVVRQGRGEWRGIYIDFVSEGRVDVKRGNKGGIVLL